MTERLSSLTIPQSVSPDVTQRSHSTAVWWTASHTMNTCLASRLAPWPLQVTGRLLGGFGLLPSLTRRYYNIFVAEVQNHGAYISYRVVVLLMMHPWLLSLTWKSTIFVAQVENHGTQWHAYAFRRPYQAECKSPYKPAEALAYVLPACGAVVGQDFFLFSWRLVVCDVLLALYVAALTFFLLLVRWVGRW